MDCTATVVLIGPTCGSTVYLNNFNTSEILTLSSRRKIRDLELISTFYKNVEENTRKDLQRSLLMYKGWITEIEWLRLLYLQRFGIKLRTFKALLPVALKRKTVKALSPVRRNRPGGRK